MTDLPSERAEITDRPGFTENAEADLGPDTTDGIVADGPSAADLNDEPPADDEPVRYRPREGVDYIVDFYGVANIPRGASDDEVKAGLRKAWRDYHPDRVEGLADEFKARAVVVSDILGRASDILTDPKKRQDYDALLDDWAGPVSTDGTPVMTMEAYQQKQAAMLGAEAVRGMLANVDEQIAAMIGTDDRQLDAAKRLAEKYPDDPDARAALEEKLLERDRQLAIMESKRRELAGADNPTFGDLSQRRYRVGLGYAREVSGEIEAARSRLQNQAYAEAIGNAGRLAILGVADDEPAMEVLRATSQADMPLPAAFDVAAADIADIAQQREAILEQRLANMQVEYPAEKSPDQTSNYVIVGLSSRDETVWLAFERNPDDPTQMENVTIHDDVNRMLQIGHFAAVANQGYGIITAPLLEQIEPTAIVGEAVTRYYNRGTKQPADAQDN